MSRVTIDCFTARECPRTGAECPAVRFDCRFDKEKHPTPINREQASNIERPTSKAAAVGERFEVRNCFERPAKSGISAALRVRMRKTSAGFSGWPSLFPQKVRLIRTGQICENLGYYGNLFTLKLPDGSLAEYHRRELRLDVPAPIKPSASHHSRSKPV